MLSRKGMRGLYYAFFAMKKTSEWTRTAVRPEPSESVLSRKDTAWFMFRKLLQQKMLPNGLEPPLPASEAGALSLKLRKHRKKYKTKSSALQDGRIFFKKKKGFFQEKRDFQRGYRLENSFHFAIMKASLSILEGRNFMQEDFLTRIRSSYNQFTKAERRVADFILQNPNKVLFMSISDLAETCNVGDTSVFRFCKTMNVKGYQEFKMTLSLSMRENEKEGGLSDNGEISLRDSISEMANKVLKDTLSSIQESFSLLDMKEVGRAIDAMSKAKRILFFGVGASMLTAMKAMNKFHRIEPKVYCSEMVSQQLMSAATMEKGDAAVIFSYSGATRDIVEIAKLAKESGATVISITRFQKSALTEYTDILLLCGANVGSLQQGSTSAEISQLFLVDIMYTEYYRRHFENCSQVLEKTSRAISDRN